MESHHLAEFDLACLNHHRIRANDEKKRDLMSLSCQALPSTAKPCSNPFFAKISQEKFPTFTAKVSLTYSV